MRIRNAFILFAFVPSLLAYTGSPLGQELTADGIINWLRGGGSNFKTEGKFRRRDDPPDSCTYGYASEAFLRFNGIFFGDFTTTGGHSISGPLAVRGNMSSSTYSVNSNHHVNCSDIKNNLNGYGLVVGGHYNGGYNTVRGAIFLPEGTNTSTVEQLDNNCPTVTYSGTGLLDFDQTYTNAIFASKELSKLAPTLLLSRNGTLSAVNNPVGKFHVATMNTCKGGCKFHKNQLSSPTIILYGLGFWGGPLGMPWPEYLVVNIPVSVGSSIYISSDKLSEGMKVCTTVYNFYPADAAGNYSPGRINVNRNTGGPIAGLTLAPEADVNEFRTGDFAGQLIANNYNWKLGGVDIKDYSAFGGSCTGFLGCLPLSNITRPVFPPGFTELLPASTSSITFNTVTDQTIGGSSRVTVTVTIPAATITYRTETFDISSTATITYSTVTKPISSISSTDETIEVVTETVTSSSESESSSEFVTSTTSASATTITISSEAPTISEEVEYCTYGGYPHIHEGKWYDHKEYQKYDEDNSDDDDEENDDDEEESDNDEEENDDDEEYNDDKQYHKGGENKKYHKDD